MTKFSTTKHRSYLLVGISWIFLVSPYWPDAINLIMGLSLGALLNEKTYFFIANGLIPIVHFTWIMAFTDLIYKERQKLILSLFTIEIIIFESYFLSLLFISPSLIGTQLAPFYVEWANFIVFYLIFSIGIFLGTGLLFAALSLKSNKNDVRLKGKFLMIGFLLFAIGIFMDAIGSLTEITLVLARTFVTLGAFMFYIGFILPQFINRIFLKTE